MPNDSMVKLNLVWLTLGTIAATSVTQGFISFEFMTIFTLFMIAGFIDQHLQYK